METTTLPVSNETTPSIRERRLKIIQKYQWKKGCKSPNPLGPKASYIQRIKELTGGGVEMVDTMVKLMRGQKIKGVNGYLTYNHIITATTWLAEQIFGKAPLMVSNGNGQTFELQKLLYMELVKSGTESGTYNVKETSLLGQDLPTEQLLQDPLKNGNPKVPVESNPSEHPEGLHRDESDQAHKPKE